MKLQKRIIMPKLASEHECTACLACENVCVQKAISHIEKLDGHTYVSIDEAKCIGCLKCQNICSASRNCYGENSLNHSKIYAAWSKDEENRGNATSGGVFAEFAEKILENGGCIIGAELDGFSCRHIVVHEKKNLKRLQGSKYMSSSMENVYHILKEELPRRDVLFAGLGCQCAGVLSFMSEIKTTHKLYTIDLVCGGVPSKLLIERFREEYPNVTGIISFRNKDKYELKVQEIEGEKVLSEKTLPLHGFNCGMTNRYNCYECQFAKAHRKTDVTIGDLWDYSVESDEHKQGISMIIVHSKKGLDLVSQSNVQTKEIEWKGPLLHNKRTVCGHQNVYLPRKNLVNNYKKMGHTRFKLLYTMSMGINQVDLFIFRVYRYLCEKRLSLANEKYINEIVNNSGK